MWDFDLLANLRLMLRTWPYILLQVAVSLVALVGGLAVTGLGSVLGYSVAAGFGDVDTRIIGGCLGALAGFVCIWVLLRLVREYILYLVTAGQIAVLVSLMDGQPVPFGPAQLRHGAQEVKLRFAQASALFVLHEFIHGVTRFFTALVSFLPVSGLSAAVNAFLKVSIGLIDEIILAYAIRTRSEDPWQAARHALVLYAQNAGAMMRNAAWLALFIHLATLLSFVVGLGLAALVMPVLPGWSWVVAVILAFVGALILRATVIRSLAVACLWQAFMRTTHGQQPDPAWEARLRAGTMGRGWLAMPGRAV